MNEVLTQPNKIALSEKCAQKYFGKENPIGQTIITGENNVTTRVREDGTIEEGKNETTYQIAAVLKSRKQSYIDFDAVIGNDGPLPGGVCLFMANRPIRKSLPNKSIKTAYKPLFLTENTVCTLYKRVISKNTHRKVTSS